MEGGVRKGRWSKNAPAGTILLLMCMFVPALTEFQQKNCSTEEYPAGNGLCCNKCAPGYKLVEKCKGHNQRSKCAICPESQYSDQLNHFPNCRRCTVCKEKYNEKTVSPCERHRNAVCQCMEGYYRSFIDSGTSQCLSCSRCGSNEREKLPCTHERNTVCECRENYYRVNNKCEPCQSCTAECKHFCSSPSQSTKPPDLGGNYLGTIIGGAAAVVVVIFVLTVVITHIATKRTTKNKLLKLSSEASENSQDSAELGLMVTEKPVNDSLRAAPQSPVSDQELSNLPDCVPLEIKISELIYAVLSMVPVHQVKQLSRLLGIQDSEIEHAELDYRSSREAHYQMLRVWAERGARMDGGARGGMLHRPLLQELLDKLREMNLVRAAEELETKYSIQ